MLKQKTTFLQVLDLIRVLLEEVSLALLLQLELRFPSLAFWKHRDR